MYKIIDISNHNGDVRMDKVKADTNANVDGIIIRIGYRGYGKAGTLVTDKNFDANIKNAINAGFTQTAFYWVTQALNEAEASGEADYAFAKVSKYAADPLIYLDVEFANDKHSGRADHLSKEQRTRNAISFCDRLKGLGGRAGIYSSDSWFKTSLDADRLSGYSIWVAKYSAKKPENVAVYDGWQHSSRFKVNGITEPEKGCDVSEFSRSLNDIR